MKNIKIIIPARLGSSRFYAKPLKNILGIPLVIRVAKICQKALKKQNIFIATDSVKIAKIASNYGFKSIMTKKNNLTGTDRVAEASLKVKGDIFINVQGDEPLILASDIKKIIKQKVLNFNKVVCGFCVIQKKEDPNKNSIPKVVLNEKNELIYISRSLIPGSKKKIKSYLKQVCIYAFNKKELRAFKNFKRKGKLEKIEDIEILRFFELNKKIHMVKVSNNSYSVDYPSDILQVEKLIKKK